MIVITGACGFIGSNLLKALNALGYDDIVIVDNLNKASKFSNIRGGLWSEMLDLSNFQYWLEKNHKNVEFVFHLGAKTDTTSQNELEFSSLNYHYSVNLWRICSEYQIPFLYASSAATYGLSNNFNENQTTLYPINKYANSKYLFDVWSANMVNAEIYPPNYYGLKFFNVYGPNEYHKRSMASVIYHFYNQIITTQKVKLYKSYLHTYKDGEQIRDFIYVKDLIRVMLFFMRNKPASGIYNVGTGRGKTYKEVASVIALHAKSALEIEYVDMPNGLRKQYQYYTEANIDKLRSVGYTDSMIDIYGGVSDYVGHYLDKRYL